MQYVGILDIVLLTSASFTLLMNVSFVTLLVTFQIF